MNDIVLNKAEIIERALRRATDTYFAHRDTLERDFDAQDVIVLNLQRVCEAAIDLAMHVVRLKGLGLPKDSRDGFTLLECAGVIDAYLADHLRKMVAFRNIAVHDYRTLDWTIIRAILEKETGDIAVFSKQMVKDFAGLE